MISRHKFIMAACLAAASAFVAPLALAQQGNTVIKLDYGAGSTCDFNTDVAGINISGSSANEINAHGQFDPASNCPTGGGNTGVAQVTLTATPATLEPGQNTNIVWSATADTCRYDGSVLPGAVAGWASSGYACIGASACQAGGNINPLFNVSGNYNLKLTCYSGAHGTQPQTSDSASASVTVSGTPPPSETCAAAPQGYARQTFASAVTDMSGLRSQHSVDLTQWLNVFGYNYQSGKSFAPWPGYIGGEVKAKMASANQYWSMEFTVPSDYPYYNATNGWNGSYGPYGQFSTFDTNVDLGSYWQLTITSQCGDFAPADQRCTASYTENQSGPLLWFVPVPGQEGSVFNMCPLARGQTYYLNIRPVSGCTGSSCRMNFKLSGNFKPGTQQ